MLQDLTSPRPVPVPPSPFPPADVHGYMPMRHGNIVHVAAAGIKQLCDVCYWCKMDLEATADQMVTLLTVNPQRV